MKARIDSFEEKDQIWAVFDRDEHRYFEESIQRAQRHKIGVARSNPCFELWLILHTQDFDKSDGRHAVQAMLTTIQAEYDPASHKWFDCAVLMPHVPTAERRAATLLKRREQERAAYGPPSTTVHHLTAAIRKAAEAANPVVKTAVEADGLGVDADTEPVARADSVHSGSYPHAVK